MGLFGLGSFGEGLVKGLAESATVSLQDEMSRIEDSIKSASDIRIKRIVQDQDRRRDEAEKIVKALKRARANLGGVDNPQAAARAASLLKQEGDLDSFNTLIDQISKRTDMDFDKYFGDVSKMSPAASDLDIAYSFIDETTIPLPSSKVGLEAVKPKGILSYLGPDIDAEKLVEERTADQMQLMDLGVRDIRKVAVPTIEFKEEAFNMDGMTAEEEFSYIQNKLAKGNLTGDKRTFYSGRASQLAGNMGLDKRMELAVNRLNNAQTANEKAAAQQEVMQLGRQKRKIDAFKTGSSTEVLKLNRIEALEDGNYKEAADLSKQLVSVGAMSFQDFMSSEIASLALGDLSPTESAARKQNLLEMSTIVNEVKKQMKPDEEVTVESLSATQTHINKLVQDKLAADPDLIKAGVYFEISELTGKQVMKFATKGTEEANQQLLAEKRSQYRTEVLDELKGQVTRDPSFDVIYRAHQSGVNVDLSAKPTPPVAFVPSEAQINTAKLPKYDDPTAFADIIKQNATQNNSPINIDNIIATAIAAGRDENYIENLRVALATPEPKPTPEPIPKPQPDPAAAERNAKVDAIVDRFHNPAFSPTLIGQPSKVNRLIREELGLENTPENKQLVDKLMEESAARFALQLELKNEQQAEEARQAAEGRPRLGIMSRDPSKVKQRIQ